MGSSQHGSVGCLDMIDSLLDTDLYKYTMSQYAWTHYPSDEVTFRFTNRTRDVKLGQELNLYKLETELIRVQGLKFTAGEIEYLRSLGLFNDTYLEALQDLLVLPEVHINRFDGHLDLRTTGLWWQVTLWETFVMSIVNELYFEKLTKSWSDTWANGIVRLDEKRHVLRGLGLNITDFGTRRRYSGDWQRFIVNVLARDGIITGTSNLAIAKELGIPAVGTYAHEMEMVLNGITPAKWWADFAANRIRFMLNWFRMYDDVILLTDTYGSKFFFDSTLPNFAGEARGLRHDSGDPFMFINRAVDWYKKLGVNPAEKVLVFSDSLNYRLIMELAKACEMIGIGCAFGWGTDLTNDVGFKPLSTVMKASSLLLPGYVQYPLTKLSDNPAKALGTEEEIKRVMAAVDYEEQPWTELRS